VASTDSTEARVAAAVALTAALFSPRMRGMLRRGAVHGLAGMLTAGDTLASFARGVSRGVQEPTTPRSEPAAHAAQGPQVQSATAAASDPVAGAAPSAAATVAATGAATVTGTAAGVAPRARKRRAPKSKTASAAPSDAATATTDPVADRVEGTRE
jgi:predicted lipid-binding transport protein (Tim44 family)